eukprot:14840518-Ditylum_brightwellii.AAC.1
MFCKLVKWKEEMKDMVSYRRVAVKEEMDNALFKHHVKHFSQTETEKTPFTTNLLKQLGSYADKTLGNFFHNLEKETPDLDLDAFTKEFVSELKRKESDPPKIDTTITTTNVKNNYKIWKEQTNTSPDDRCLTLYKTWLKVAEEKAEEYDGLTSEEFFKVITAVIKLCQQHNIVLPRWVT